MTGLGYDAPTVGAHEKRDSIMATYTAAQTDDLARLAAIVNVAPAPRFPGDDWDSYNLTVTRAGRSYPVGGATVYDDGRGILVSRHYDADRYATTRAAWRALEDAFQLTPRETWQQPRPMFLAEA